MPTRLGGLRRRGKLFWGKLWGRIVDLFRPGILWRRGCT
jgi:hypothetical protein